MKATRAEINAAIDSERDYQDGLGPNRTDSLVRSVTGELLLMEEYIARARFAWVEHSGDAETLDVIRKVVGIGVRCMEHHGAPKREIPA